MPLLPLSAIMLSIGNEWKFKVVIVMIDLHLLLVHVWIALQALKIIFLNFFHFHLLEIARVVHTWHHVPIQALSEPQLVWYSLIQGEYQVLYELEIGGDLHEILEIEYLFLFDVFGSQIYFHICIV